MTKNDKLTLINDAINNLNKLRNALMCENAELTENNNCFYNFTTAACLLNFDTTRDFVSTLKMHKIIKLLARRSNTNYYEANELYKNWFFKASKFSHLKITEHGLGELKKFYSQI